MGEGSIPAGRVRAGPLPPGAQGVDEVEVQQPVEDRLLAGHIASYLGREQVDGGGVGRVLVRGRDDHEGRETAE
jgi:hypothetical protein